MWLQNKRESFDQLHNYYFLNKNRIPWEVPCQGGLEYLNRGPASHTRRWKGNPMPGAITGPPSYWGHKCGDMVLQVWG
jgi:hypothetical protein